MEGNRLEDKELTCKDCGQVFIFFAGEQSFFRSKGLSEPKRCPTCRKRRKATLVPDNRAVNNEW